MSEIEISIIIPTHKRKDYLFFELAQIYKQREVEFEVIVVNDLVDEDDTDEITIIYPKVIYIKDDKIQGPSNKHKAGYAIAKGKYLYMPDDDDYLIDSLFFKKSVDILNQDSNLAFVSGNVFLSYETESLIQIKEEKHYLNLSGRIDGRKYLQKIHADYKKPVSTVSTIFRKLAFDELNAKDMIEMSDSSMYILSLIWGDAYIMNTFVAKYRIKANSLTTTVSVPFIYNVLYQKEVFLELGKHRIIDVKAFWNTHFNATYLLLAGSKNKKSEKVEVLFWGLKHLHGSIKLAVSILKSLIKLMIK